jgi:phage baseplate assembly protein W
MTDVPRLAWPLQLAANGQLATVEQDSDEDITQCLRAILLHRVGDRTDVPELGVPDLTHGEQPLDLDGIEEVVRRHEPRVDVLLSTQPDALDQAIADVALQWRRPSDRDMKE